jgi:hypothetical protein
MRSTTGSRYVQSLFLLAVLLVTSGVFAQDCPALLTLGGVVRDKDTGAPIADQVLRLKRYGETGRGVETVSDAQGRFSFTTTPGWYLLSNAGCADGHCSEYFPFYYPGQLEAAPFRLDTSQTNLVFPLQHAPAVNHITVQVLDITNAQPVAGAKVRLSSLRTSYLLTTGADGKVLVRGAITDTHNVQAWRSPTHLEADLGFLTQPGIHPIDIVRVYPGARLTGRVLNEAGAPLTSFTVEAIAMKPERSAASFEVDSVDGRFEVGPLPPGQYRIAVHADEHRTQYQSGVANAVDAPILETHYGSVHDLGTLTLQRGAAIDGRLVATGTACFANVRMTARNLESGMTRTVDVAADGTFRIGGLHAGRYTLTFGQHDQEQTTVAGGCAASSDSGCDVIVVPVSGSVPVTVMANVAKAPGVATITGRVSSVSTKASAALAVVRVEGADGSLISEVRTSPLGEFRVTVPAGCHFVSVSNAGDLLGAYLPGGTTARESVCVAAGETRTLNAALLYGATIRGRVVDAATGLPLANIPLRLVLADGTRVPGEFTSAPDGKFVIRGVPEGTVRVEAEGLLPYADASSAAISIVGRPDIQNVEVRVAIGGSICGRAVRGAGAGAIGGIWIEAIRAADLTVAGRAQTSTDGTYCVGGLSGGTYLVRFSGNEQYAPVFAGGTLDPAAASRHTVSEGAVIRDVVLSISGGARRRAVR